MESHTKASVSGSCSAAAGAHRGLFSHSTLAVLNITTKYKFLPRAPPAFGVMENAAFF
jgi:hypothetical protein